MKKIMVGMGIVVCLFCFSCEKQDKTPFPEIQIGKDEAVEELALNRQTERTLFLSGGNGKYAVSVENSKVAHVRVSRDTLRVKGLWEGETFATVISHDKSRRLKIKVVPSRLSFSHKAVRLYPKDRSKFVSLTGGGERVKLDVDDPEHIMDVKWDGETNILEIRAFYEGEANITATGEDGEKQNLSVTVKAADELEEIGLYGTDEKYFSSNKMIGNVMTVQRAGMGTWIINSARPYGGWINTYRGAYLKVAPVVNPVQGTYMDVNVLRFSLEKPRLKEGVHRVYVEEVRDDNTVVLRGRGFKFLLPFSGS